MGGQLGDRGGHLGPEELDAQKHWEVQVQGTRHHHGTFRGGPIQKQECPLRVLPRQQPRRGGSAVGSGQCRH